MKNTKELIADDSLKYFKKIILNGLKNINVKIEHLELFQNKEQKEEIELALCFQCPCGSTLTEVISAPINLYVKNINCIIRKLAFDLTTHLKEDGL